MIAFAFLGSAMTLATSVPQTRLGCPRHPMTSAGVLATEHEWVRAIEARDSRALSCILADDFADTNWRGELVPRSAVLGRLSSRPPSRLKLNRSHGFAERPTCNRPRNQHAGGSRRAERGLGPIYGRVRLSGRRLASDFRARNFDREGVTARCIAHESTAF